MRRKRASPQKGEGGATERLNEIMGRATQRRQLVESPNTPPQRKKFPPSGVVRELPQTPTQSVRNEQRVQDLRTMPYLDYLRTPEWEARRQQVLERDGHRCRVCNGTEQLNVHHRTYERRGDEDLNDLTTLCRSCHEYFHHREKGGNTQVVVTIENNGPDITLSIGPGQSLTIKKRGQ